MPTGSVFISHSSRDAALAHDLVAALEAAGVACWISGRDVAPGGNYQEAIVGAITGARAMVLLLTEAANASDEVKKELSLASAQGITVYPVLIESVQPNAALRYELATRQWIEGGEVAVLAARLAAVIGAGASPPQAAAGASLPLALPDKPSLVVLPFQNMSGDPEQAYFADGMVEEITIALSRVRWLFVIARNSAFAYKDRQIDVRQVGRELGVRYVLEGSVRRAGNRVRITGQVVEAASGASLWADRFDGALDDVFDLQDRVTAHVVAAVAPRLRGAEIALARRKPVASLHVYDLFLQALALMHSTAGPALAEGIRLAAAAIALEPGYAMAHAVKARMEYRTVVLGHTPPDEGHRADYVAAARYAAALAPEDPDVLWLAAFTLALGGGDLVAARDLVDRALALNPNSAEALTTSGLVGSYACEPNRALPELDRAARLDPLSGDNGYIIHQARARLMFCQGDWAAAAACAELSTRALPSHTSGRVIRIASLGQLGNTEAATRAVAELLAIDPTQSVARQAYLYGHFYAAAPAFLDGLRRAGLPEG